MSSVTPTKTDQDNLNQKGTGKGIALFFCVLFFLFQLFCTFFKDSPRVQQEKHLTFSSNDSVRLSITNNSQKTFQTSNVLFTDSPQISPFFFKPLAINHCDVEMLVSVKGIGPKLAESIIKTRTSIGKFSKAEDLLQVKGIGHSRMLKFKQYFSFW